jgi:lysophospholipase II
MLHKSSVASLRRLTGTALLGLGVTVAAAMSSSASSKRGALIFLHGLGDSPAGWSQLQWSLPQMKPRLKEIKFVFPAAPTIPISINGGMEMPG